MVDGQGGTGVATELTFTVDTTPPGTADLVAPPDGAFLNDSTPLFDWNPASGDIFDYLLQVTSGDFIAGPFAIDVVVLGVGKAARTDFQTPPALALADDLYRWRVIARDRATNTASSLIRTFTVDTVAPGAPGLVEPRQDERVGTLTPNFIWNASTGDPFVYRLLVTSGDIVNGPFDIDEEIPHTAGQPTFQFLATGDLALEDGATYEWRVVARDEARNANTSDTRTFNISLSQQIVNLVLEADPNTVGVGSAFSVTIIVEPNGQPVSTVDVFLNFTTGNVRVEKIDPGPTAEIRLLSSEDLTLLADLTLETVLLSTSDNNKGTVDITATTVGAPATGDFVLATVTFRVIREPVGLEELVTTDFNTTFPRKTDAFFDGESVLTADALQPAEVTILKPTVDILLTTDETEDYTLDGEIPALIKVKPNGQRVSTVDVFLDFGTGDLRVVRIEPGDGALNIGVISTFDNINGTVNIKGTTTGDPVTGDFILARIIVTADGTIIDFQTEFPRRTDALFDTAFVLRNLSVIPGPALVSPGSGDFLNANTPLFDWDVLTTGDVVDYRLQVTSGDINTGPFAIDVIVPHPTTEYQSIAILEDYWYRWSVTARDALNPQNTASSVVRAFNVDTTPPTRPANPTRTTGVAQENATKSFAWTRSADPGFPTTGSGVDFYNVEIRGAVGNVAVVSGIIQHESCGPNTGGCQFVLTTADRLALVPGAYTLRVNAVDRATNTSDAATLPFQEGSPNVVQNLKVLDPVFGNTVNTATPTFQWNEPADLPSDGIATYEVAFGTADGPAFIGGDFKDFNDSNLFVTVCLVGGVTGDCGTAANINAANTTILLTLVNPQPDNGRRIGVRVVDGLDAAGDPQELIFTVDTTPPGTADLVAPENGAVVSTSTPFFNWEPSPSSGDVFDYLLQVVSSGNDFNAGPFVIEVVVPGTGASAATEFQTTGDLADGGYQWRVVARDQATNTASSLTRTFTVDKVAPWRASTCVSWRRGLRQYWGCPICMECFHRRPVGLPTPGDQRRHN